MDEVEPMMRFVVMALILMAALLGLATAQPQEIPLFPSADPDRDLTAVVQKFEIELVGKVHTFAYATDTSVDAVIAFYAALGFRRVDVPDWEDFSEKEFGVRIRRVWMLHSSTPEHYRDARDWKLFVGIERPYARVRALSEFPSPANVVQRTGIIIADRR